MKAIFTSLLLLPSAGIAVETNDTFTLVPPYQELPPTFWEQHGVSVAIGGLGVVTLAVFGLWLIFRCKPQVVIPPEEQARQELEQLRQQPESAAVLSRISQVMRHYFILVFQLASGELTTTEFGHELARGEKINRELATAATEFLRDCDTYKFAPQKDAAKMDAANRALKLIEQAEQQRTRVHPPIEAQIQKSRK